MLFCFCESLRTRFSECSERTDAPLRSFGIAHGGHACLVRVINGSELLWLRRPPCTLRPDRKVLQFEQECT